VPLVADIHFQPAVAMMVAEAFEKVRINPGNFVDGRKSFEQIDYDDPAEFEAERARIEEVRCNDCTVEVLGSALHPFTELQLRTEALWRFVRHQHHPLQ
jgi:4-hydroxy-3-methylbut-2-en-1-yl diphosphate synthase IspG/GcpE